MSTPPAAGAKDGTTGLLDAFLLDGKGGATRLDWAGVRAWSANDGVLWVNLDYSMPDARAWLVDESRIDELTLDALTDADPRPRTTAYGDDLMMIVRGINQNQGSAPEDMISIRAWIEPRRIVTMRHRVSRSLQALATDVARGRGAVNAGDLAVQLVERIVDHVVTRVDMLGEALAESEDAILSEKHGGDLRSQLADHRRRAIALRRFLAPQREALTKLGSIEVPWLDDRHHTRFAECGDRMTRTIEELDAARDRAAVTQEEVSTRMSELSNQRLYVLSIITAIFLPLGFVCSLLGVNVGGVPLQKQDWAFWALIGVFIVGVATQLWIFRKRGWIKRD